MKTLTGGNMVRTPSRWLAAAALVLFGAACSQDVGDINRVQPNVVRKTDLLDGTWYFRNTVTWTPPTTGFTFTGETGNLEKIVFEIQENYLVGYRAYAFIPGSEETIEASSKPSGTTSTYCSTDAAGKRTCVGGQKFYGAPVVAYPIKKHFDIQRQYSTTTGEDSNVIAENSSDRPWNEREFIRVDWSASKLNRGTSMLWNTVQNPAGATSINAWVQANEPGTDPYDWPTFEYTGQGGAKKLTYFDFTGRYYAKPDEYTFDLGNGQYVTYPLCYFVSGFRYDCASQEIRMRTSIARVDPAKTNDYEPLVYTNDLMKKFGYFRTERLNYDRKFGVTESERILLANRWNLWEKSHEFTNGQPDLSKPIPFAQRQPKPIVYYFTPMNRMGGAEAHATFLEAGKVLAKNWDKAFKRAVAAAQTGSDANWQSVKSSKGGDMFVLCETPVPEGADPACGPKGFEPKFGDLRYSFLWTIADAVPNGLLGYGPSSADPETGEIISANANTYSAAVDYYGQYGLDVVDILTGEKSLDEFVRGTDVQKYMLSNPAYASALQNKTGALQAELQDIVRTNETSTGAFSKTVGRLQNVLQALRTNGLAQAGVDRLSAAAEMLRQNPVIEAAVLDNAELKQDILGMVPAAVAKAALEDPAIEREAVRAAILKYPSLRAQNERRLQWAAEARVEFAEFFDRPVLGYALEQAKKRTERINELVASGSTPADAKRLANEELRRRIRQGVWRATSEHEVGHTVGLRHNFQGSFDAINFHDAYWDLKKETLTVVQGGTRVVPRTPADLKAASDGTQEQLAAGIHDHELSTIMDYAGKFQADFKGLGKYDEAAILFAYSGGREPGYVEVFNEARTTPLNVPGSDGKQLPLTGAGVDLPIINAEHRNTAVPNFTERFHYSTVPLRFGVGSAGNLPALIEDGIQKLRSRSVRPYSQVKAEIDKLRAVLASGRQLTAADVEGAPLEVPYMFCTDDHVGYILSCNRHDRGADYYEMTRTWLEDYWNDYFFNHFKRDRYYFTANGALNNAAITFMDTGMVYRHWVHALQAGNATSSSQTTARYNYDATMQDTWSMAVFDGINNLLRTLSVPEAGFYMRRTATNEWQLIAGGQEFDNLDAAGQKIFQDYYGKPQNGQPAIADAFAVLPRGEARRMYSRYDFRSGFGFERRMVEVGHYYDQIGAIIGAVEAAQPFLGVDTQSDLNRYYIPYYLLFDQELTNHFSSLWTYQLANVNPTVYLEGTKPVVFHGNWVNGANFIDGFNYPATPAAVTDPAKKASKARLQPSWSTRIYSLYFGMAGFSVNYDFDFAKKNLVYRLGGDEQVTPPAGHTVFEVTDPKSGIRYATVQKTGEPDTAATILVKEAKAYVDANNPDAASGTIQDLDLMRGMYEIYGKAF